MRIYIDTSVINGLYAQDSAIIRVTRDFFQSAKFGKYILYGSNLLLEEIDKTKNANLRQQLMEVIEEHHIDTLPLSEEVKQLAECYVEEKIIPARYIADAMHIAFASVHNIPVLASWNFEHIVKHKTRAEVNRINKEKGYPQIDICSPQEID